MVTNPNQTDHDKLIQLEERVNHLLTNLHKDKSEMDTKIAVLDGISDSLSKMRTEIDHINKNSETNNCVSKENCELHRIAVSEKLMVFSKSLSMFNKIMLGTIGITIFGIIIVYIKDTVQTMFAREMVSEIRIMSNSFLDYLKNNNK